MHLINIKNSIFRILQNENVNRFFALYKYIEWSFVKLFNKFPLKLTVSESTLLITNKSVAKQGGTKIYTQGLFDYNNMNLFRFCAKNLGGVFFDIGANLGIYSLLFSEFSKTKVFAFEPTPSTFQKLNANLAYNKRDNVVAINKAISRDNGICCFSNKPYSSVNKIIKNDQHIDSIEVEKLTISSFCSKNDIKPDFVKIDVEGFELDVLLGFNSILEKVQVFVIEISENRNEIIKLLNISGFIGPLYFDFRNKQFHRNSLSKLQEDPVFISQEFLNRVQKKYQFSILESTI
ncbi:MAG: FkbM family methyltransferase [Calditrichaeota bacterium]|nr:MAG: FkbM family methyltransferase [Calditrichota bacterium]